MTATPVLLVEHREHTLLLTLNRAHVRNAVDIALAEALGDALEAADSDRTVRVVVLTGSGDVSFCAGGDLKAIAAGEPVAPMDERRRGWGFAGYVAHPISKPTIAAVNGFALGGGTEIVLASDLAVASESATFGLPEVSRGLTAAAGGAFRLPRQIPRKVAMEMLLTGDAISAARACELGLVNQVVAPPDVVPAAMALADRIACNAPEAVEASKAIAEGMDGRSIPREESDWRRSLALRTALLASSDAQEGVAAFGEKRAPGWVSA